MTEKEKMISGQLYDASDPHLVSERNNARTLLRQVNIGEFDDPEQRRSILYQLLPNADKDIMIEPPFFCDYGYNIYTGEKVFFNFNCIVLDVCPVYIGSNTMFGPGVHIYTVTHPENFMERRAGKEFGKPVSIGEDCWIGGSAIILPGVKIGDRCIIGAGAIVTKDVPDDAVFTGNNKDQSTKSFVFE